MSITNNKSFCALAWANLTTDTAGDLKTCCVANEHIRKSDGSKFNLGYDTISDIYNSEHYKTIRNNMIAGIPVAGCENCYNAERNGGKSNRYYHNIEWYDIVKDKVQQTIDGLPIEPTVDYFDIRFGNLCNLACRSCYPNVSSQLNKEVKELQHTSILKFMRPLNEDVSSWYDTDIFHANMHSQIHNVKMFYMTGGEPTLIERNLEFLQHLIDIGVSKNVTLKFNTNMTNTKQEFYGLLPHFKKIHFMPSIDGVGLVQEYLRYPSKWKQISTNLEKLVDMKLSNVVIRVHPVISNVNLEYITDLFEYLEVINRKHNAGIIQITPTVLTLPPYLNLENLPLSYKIKCWSKIVKWLETSCRYQNPQLKGILKQLQAMCLNDVDYTENLKNFFEYTDILDNSRGQRLEDVNPTLASFRAK